MLRGLSGHAWADRTRVALRPDLVAVDNPNSPRESVGNFGWTASPTMRRLMEYVLELQGAERVVMGSDYPFPLG